MNFKDRSFLSNAKTKNVLLIFVIKMKNKKHYTIPVFVPELACPFQCAFCNQSKISGHQNIPTEKEITKTFDTYLNSFKEKDRHVEVGFFGGTFTGISLAEQENYLRLVQPYIDSGKIQGIRLSTRPDFINSAVLSLLKKYRVTTIELGAQSLDDEVLKASYRGHTALQVEQASEMILDADFDLGLQMMIGLPGDSLKKTLLTAWKIVALGASNTRIYPALVIRDTAMHTWYKQGKYNPLSMEEAVEWSKPLLLLFEKENVDVIRMGLHPSESLLDHTDLVAGPFHPSFRELVLTQIWRDLLIPLLRENKGGKVEIEVSPSEINAATGYSAENKKMLLKHFREVKFTANSQLKGRAYNVKPLPV